MRSKIAVAVDLKSYFETELAEVCRKQGRHISPFALNYLSQVLSRFADASRYLTRASGEREFPTLAFQYLESFHLHPQAALESLQQLGDTALFTAGFFPEWIDRRAMDMDYYQAMGEQAYEAAGRIKENLHAERLLNVYFELASRFEDCVELFAEISDQKFLGDDKEILALYEKWLRKRSDRIQRMLMESGVIPASAKVGKVS
jgi:hypothetical protein